MWRAGVAHLDGRLEVAEFPLEGRRLGDDVGVVELQPRQHFARVDERAGHLGEGDMPRLASVQREEHLHDLDLGKGRALVDVRAVLDEQPGELAAVGRRQDARVDLRFERHDLRGEPRPNASKY